MKKDNRKNEWKRMLISTYITDVEENYNEETWKEYNKEFGYTDEENPYDDYVAYSRECDIDDFFMNLGSSSYLNKDYLVTGTVHGWNGNHEIEGTYFNNLEEAINECIKDCYDFKVFESNDGIEVHNMHHDGTNVFYIRLLSKKGIAKADRMDYDDVRWTEADFLHPRANKFYLY